MNMTVAIAVIGIVVLLVMAVGVGMSLDTEAQRRAARQLAEERRLRALAHHAAPGTHCPGCPWRHRS